MILSYPWGKTLRTSLPIKLQVISGGGKFGWTPLTAGATRFNHKKLNKVCGQEESRVAAA